jgi:hypothetical protein
VTNEERIEQLKHVPPRPRRTRWELFFAVVGRICSAIAIITFTFLAVLAWRDNVTQRCIKTWADASTQRTQALAPLNNRRVDLLLTAFFDAAAGGNGTAKQRREAIATIKSLRKDYPGLPSDGELAASPTRGLIADIELIRSLQANAEYKQRVSENPIPVPDFNCSLF